jgi:hypothetical protein
VAAEERGQFADLAGVGTGAGVGNGSALPVAANASCGDQAEFVQSVTCSTISYGTCERLTDCTVTPAIRPVVSIRQKAVPAVTSVDEAMERCRSAGIGYELEQNDPAPGWTYRRLLIRTPGGYRLVVEGPNE